MRAVAFRLLKTERTSLGELLSEVSSRTIVLYTDEIPLKTTTVESTYGKKIKVVVVLPAGQKLREERTPVHVL